MDERIADKFRTPGVIREVVAPPDEVPLRTGVPMFIGYTTQDDADAANPPKPLTLWADFERRFGKPKSGGFLAHAVRGFFENQGEQCYVMRLDDEQPFTATFKAALRELELLDCIDLVAAPDIMAEDPNAADVSLRAKPDVLALQRILLAHCFEMGDRLAILDSVYGADVTQAKEHRTTLKLPMEGAETRQAAAARGEPEPSSAVETAHDEGAGSTAGGSGQNKEDQASPAASARNKEARAAAGVAEAQAVAGKVLPDVQVAVRVAEMQGRDPWQLGNNAALYYPWIRILDGPNATGGFVPPCGHIAGIFSQIDRRVGVHRAPANEIVAGALDLEWDLTDTEQGELNPEGVNALRAFRGRGIRVWGARTLSYDPAWRYISVRRVFLTALRWIDRNLSRAVFEPNSPIIWGRIERDLTVYFEALFRQGALKGASPQEAFYVRCNEHTNPEEARDAGLIVTEIGLAPAIPSEFIVVRLVQSARGATIIGPSRII